MDKNKIELPKSLLQLLGISLYTLYFVITF